MPQKTLQITVNGLIQGVGFRPFVYRTALRQGLKGWVQNTNENVRIRISGDPLNIEHFLHALITEAPAAASVQEIFSEEFSKEEFTEFSILESHDVSEDITEISPDIAVCSECLEDIERKGNRYNYSFVNCTNCGPRCGFSDPIPSSPRAYFQPPWHGRWERYPLIYSAGCCRATSRP